MIRVEAAGETATAQSVTPDARTLMVGCSPGAVGIAGVDAALGHKAPILRTFNNNTPPARWSANDQQPADDRLVLVSSTADGANIDGYARGDYDGAIRQWLAGAPGPRYVAIGHEGDAKVRKGIYSRAQWVAMQEHVLPLIASLGHIPVPILTYQSTIDGTATSYISAKMRAVPGVVLGIDTYSPGAPGVNVPKYVQGIADTAAAVGLPWCVPEMGAGLTNGTDKDRADNLRVVLQWCANQPDCRFVCYWPNGSFEPGPATWDALAATYTAA